jgi:hypothetical protein
MRTAGWAGLTAGTTVVIGMLGLLVLRQALLNGVAIAAAATVAMTVLASLTPLLGFTGQRLARPSRLNTFLGTVLRVQPLVQLEDYNRVSALIKSRATRGPGRKDTALLTGMVFCDYGSAMYRQHARSADYYYCNHGCPAGSRLMVKLSHLDAVVDEMIMANGGKPYIITVVTAGDDHSDEIDQIRREIRDLDPEAGDYDNRLADLRDELKNLRSLPSTRKVERKPSGKTIGEVWQSLDTEGKRRFLIDHEAKLHVRRDADQNVFGIFEINLHGLIASDPFGKPSRS